jgi:RHS repeat-associated protein
MILNHRVDYVYNGWRVIQERDMGSTPLTSYENRLVVGEVLYQDDFGNCVGWHTEFQYDGLRRSRRRLEFTPQFLRSPGASPGGVESSDWSFDYGVDYIYDGWRVIQERDRISNTPLVSYTRGNDLSGSLEGAGGIAGLLARSSGHSGGNWTSHAYYHADGNGNITCLINASQSVVASYRYDPFGNTVSQSGGLADANVYRFSSKEIHVNSGMYYYGYRFYEPSLQRWINRDPLDERGFETARFRRTPMLVRSRPDNEYVCCRNAPINYRDSLGLEVDSAGYDNCVAQCAQDRKARECMVGRAAKQGALGAALGFGVLFGIAGTVEGSPVLGVLAGGLGAGVFGGATYVGVAGIGTGLNLGLWLVCVNNCAYTYLGTEPLDPGGGFGF